ncbi:nucleotidyltransferase domain-containing protein [Methanoregula sp.]|uniref:nucleotidyltransferase domain-containing protein n=1 Tax=Methanoregula sp. TaxID=2052170 RepID=UPI000CCA5D6D|nr:nucleotidyltransferase domain-containing protein [Methanoregula sp.]PKG31601.1 MAG: hypothetical protein CW742_12555 [Methanoregula sp.]
MLLLREDLHPRAIAEKLGTNHMTVSRKLRELREDNCVDFRTEGKNKVFFVKKTLEGRNAAATAEIYRQSQAARKYPVLRGIFRTIQDEPGIQLAILFGSYAKGFATRNSDIDIFIETPDASLKNQLEQRNSSLSVKIGGFDLESPLIREIIKDHVIIRGVEAYFEKTGFFRERQGAA